MTRPRAASIFDDALRDRLRPPAMFAALRASLREGYDRRSFRADAFAGLVVGIVALPLSMALAIAIGVEPQRGLFTAIVAGSAVALAGGSRFQVTGPTAAYVAILAPIVTRHGLPGLLMTGLLAGLMLIALGVARLGKLIEFIPYPVNTGFTAGIAVVIATLQIKDIFGLAIAKQPEGYFEKLTAYWGARSTVHPAEIMVAAVTFALLLTIPKVTRKIPAPLLAIVGGALGCALAKLAFPSLEIATIGTRFPNAFAGGSFGALLPEPTLPWGDAPISYAYLRELAPSAFAIAMLGAIESLLSAVIADGMTGSKHDSDVELVSVGIGNVLSAFFGGIAASGALARTATNVRAGARSPIAAVVHAAVLLLSVLLFARLVAFIPMASLAALLLLVAWNISDARTVLRLVRVAPRADATVLVVCFLLTVLFDMVVAVSVGVVLAALLFMKRMAEFTEARAVIRREGTGAGPQEDLPQGVAVYEIAGALFFGAAQKSISSLGVVSGEVRVLVIDLGHVPVIDVTGLVALENIVALLAKRQCKVVIAGPLPQPRDVFERAELGRATIEASRALAVQRARVLIEEMKSSDAARTSLAPRSSGAK